MVQDLVRNFLAVVRSEGPAGAFGYTSDWLANRLGEYRLGIDTVGVVPLADAGVASPDPTWQDYEPASYRHLRAALRMAEVRPGEDVFLDIGAGRGRPALLAATWPFRRVIGVEISPVLCAAARANLERARAGLATRDVEFVCADALSYAMPEDVSVVFLFNPLGGDAMGRLARRLWASWQRAPRDLRVLYLYPSWAEDPFGPQTGFRCDAQRRLYAPRGAGQTWLRRYRPVPA